MKRAPTIILLLSLMLAQFAKAEVPELQVALKPLEEGVPQVAVMRLRKLLEQKKH
jgi:hypothetical protein